MILYQYGEDESSPGVIFNDKMQDKESFWAKTRRG